MKRWWLWAALGTALLLISSGQAWVSGTWNDPVIGATRITVTGTQAGATLTAGALLAGAAVLAGLVGSRPVRLAAAWCLAGGSGLAALPALRSLLRPQGAVEAVAADRPGATGLTVQATGTTITAWPWVALLGALLVLLGALLCGLHWWHTPRRGATGARGGERDGQDGAQSSSTREPRPTDAWDDLSHGRDPTVDD